jgi:hypothetical protein
MVGRKDADSLEASQLGCECSHPRRRQRTFTAAVVRDRGVLGAGSDMEAGLIPVTVPELLRLLRDTAIPPPRRDRPHRLHWSIWRRRHQYCARRAHQRWNANAETTP